MDIVPKCKFNSRGANGVSNAIFPFSSYLNAQSKVKKLILKILFPRNLSEFGFILNDLYNLTYSDSRCHSLRSKIKKNGIKPRYTNVTYHCLKFSPSNPPKRNICVGLSESRKIFPLGVCITTAHIDDVS